MRGAQGDLGGFGFAGANVRVSSMSAPHTHENVAVPVQSEEDVSLGDLVHVRLGLSLEKGVGQPERGQQVLGKHQLLQVVTVLAHHAPVAQRELQPVVSPVLPEVQTHSERLQPHTKQMYL